MNLITYPNEILEKPTIKVELFNPALHAILDEMQTIMIKNNGIGLAANQVGLSHRMFIMLDKKKQVFEMINPVVSDMEGLVKMNEGCLSAAGIYLSITRPESVLVQYQDRDGEIRRVIAEGIEARTILHEMDHLDGVFYFSKVNRAERKRAIATLKKGKK